MKERLSTEVIEQIDCMKVHLRNMQTVQEVAEVLKVDKNELDKGVAELETAMVHFMNYEKLLKSKEQKKETVGQLLMDGQREWFKKFVESGNEYTGKIDEQNKKEDQDGMSVEDIQVKIDVAIRNTRPVRMKLRHYNSEKMKARIEAEMYNVKDEKVNGEYVYIFSGDFGQVVVSDVCLDMIKSIEICG